MVFNNVGDGKFSPAVDYTTVEGGCLSAKIYDKNLVDGVKSILLPTR